MAMSTSPSPPAGRVLPAGAAGRVLPARFEVDLRAAARMPEALLTEARAAAQSVGYAAGWAEGQRAVRDVAHAAAARAEAEVRRAAADREAGLNRGLGALAAAATALERRVAPTLAELEDAMLRGALALTEALLGHELAVTRTPGADAVRRALALAPARRPVLVRLHPDDLTTLSVSDGDQYEVDGRVVTLLADQALQPGDAVAECDATTVDARLAAAVDRVREALDAAAAPSAS